MKATDVIRAALDISTNMTLPLIEDLKEHAMAFPTANGGNHALWNLGHLAYSEGGLNELMTGDPNPLAEWKELFDMGTTPSDDASKYPSFDEVMQKFHELRAINVKLLDSLSDEDLDRPSKNVPDEWKEMFGTYGQCLIMIGLHIMHHRGQVADIRRSLKKEPMMA